MEISRIPGMRAVILTLKIQNTNDSDRNDLWGSIDILDSIGQNFQILFHGSIESHLQRFRCQRMTDRNL